MPHLRTYLLITHRNSAIICWAPNKMHTTYTDIHTQPRKPILKPVSDKCDPTHTYSCKYFMAHLEITYSSQRGRPPLPEWVQRGDGLTHLSLSKRQFIAFKCVFAGVRVCVCYAEGGGVFCANVHLCFCGEGLRYFWADAGLAWCACA